MNKEDLRGPALRLDQVSRKYLQGTSTLEVFHDISFSLNSGELVALVGPSGAGKSSLLHMAGLLESPSGGEVFIDGEPASRLPDRERTRIRRERIGFVYQAHHLLPEFSALENVVMPQLIAGHTKASAEATSTRLLTMVGLQERLSHRPGELSGGEQQRVAIARALANAPKILLADEPTGNLDPGTAGGVFDILIAMVRAEGLAALVATHNYDLAKKMDRSLVLDQGKLVERSQPQG
jgi:lipoprotein-releasing system ATP-binding protein